MPINDKQGGGVVSGFISGSSSPSLILGVRLYSHGASLHPGVYMVTSEINARGNAAIKWHPI